MDESPTTPPISLSLRVAAGEDRFGERRRFPIMSVSIVAVLCDGVSSDHAQLARVAADMKKKAKAIQGSVYLRSDRERAVRSVAG